MGSTNYTSVEAFEQANQGLVGAMRNAVREELEIAQANGTLSGDAHRPLDFGQVTGNDPLVFGDSIDGISQCDECFVRIAPHGCQLGDIGGIDRLPVFHMLTSLLAIGGTIIASMAFVMAFRK